MPSLAVVVWYASLSSARPQVASTIVVGAFDDTFHQAESACVVNILQQRGYNASLLVGNHTGSFDALWSGAADILPSVWLPSGHASFVQGKQLNVDYVELGVTSEEGVFFWIASPAAVAAGVRSIDDLADPAKTPPGFSPDIFGGPADSGLSYASTAIVAQLNAQRARADPRAMQFRYIASFEANVANLEANSTSTALPFVAALWVPFWGYQRFVTDGKMTRLVGGKLGAHFGLPNRGTTLTTPALLRSGRVDAVTLGVLASMFIGNAAVSAMDDDIHSRGMSPLGAARKSQALPQNAYWVEVYRNASIPL